MTNMSDSRLHNVEDELLEAAINELDTTGLDYPDPDDDNTSTTSDPFGGFPMESIFKMINPNMDKSSIQSVMGSISTAIETSSATDDKDPINMLQAFLPGMCQLLGKDATQMQQTLNMVGIAHSRLGRLQENYGIDTQNCGNKVALMCLPIYLAAGNPLPSQAALASHGILLDARHRETVNDDFTRWMADPANIALVETQYGISQVYAGNPCGISQREIEDDLDYPHRM